MNKKKIITVSLVICIAAVIIAVIVPLWKYAGLFMQAKKLNQEFALCKKKFYEAENYYIAEQCFSDIIRNTNRIEYKYYHALALFNLMEFDKSKAELKEIIDNSSLVKNKILVSKAKNIYDFLNSSSEKELIYFIKYNDVELSEENSIRLDIGDYFSDLSKTAVWQNPQKVKVYVAKSSRMKTIKRAFQIWDEALGSTVNFVFVNDKQTADITCFCVKQLDGMRLGSTKTYFNKDKKNGKKYLSKAKMQIALHEPETNKVIDEKNILSTTLHEIGHTLGIISHSKQKGDIMYYDSSSYKQSKAEVSKRDVNTVKKIYGNI